MPGVGLLLAAAGCNLGSDPPVGCTAMAVYGLRVTVSNGVGGDGKCDVVVSAKEGEYDEQLECSADAEACNCWGASERAGTYLVRATRADGATAQKEVTVGEGECHVEPELLTLALP